MYESDTFMAILEEGREAQAKEDIACLAERRFGRAEEATVSRLNAISDLKRLRRILNRIFDATSWDDLLGTP